MKNSAMSKDKVNSPMDQDGNKTGHLIGILNRCLHFRAWGIKPIWVFDGSPPVEKLTQLRRRSRVKETAEQMRQKARQAQNLPEMAKQQKRTIFITKAERTDAIQLLRLIGVPVIEAQAEAEAQCAWLCRNNLSQFVLSTDADTLVFGANRLIKSSSNSDEEHLQTNLPDLLKSLQMTYEQFIDFCILCGCDYTQKIAGIGPVKAYKMIRNNGTIEKALQELVSQPALRDKHPIPEQFNYLRARFLFKNPVVKPVTSAELLQNNINEPELIDFLMQKQFNQTRINQWLRKMKLRDRNGDNHLDT